MAAAAEDGIKITREGYEGIRPIASISEAPKRITRAVAKSLAPCDRKGFKAASRALVKTLVGAFAAPSPIQELCWPALAAGRDLIGIAETGSGKTLAFSVPLLSRLLAAPEKDISTVRMLVIAPTRELAIQIHKVIETVSGSLVSMCLYGGTHRSEQVKELKRKRPAVVVGTPGRLVDLLSGGELGLQACRAWVLDEADRMLDMGFEPELRQMAAAMSSPHRQTVMFSATWPASVQTIASRYLRAGPVKITIQKSFGSDIDTVKAAASVRQVVEVVDGREKDARIVQLLKQYTVPDRSLIILFVLYKKEAARIELLCQRNHFDCVPLHGDMSQAAREASYEAFKSGRTRLLIATDVAARGLDIPAVSAVLNYTFPLTIEDYVHRVGRTGRAGLTGTAHTLFTAAESHLAAALVAQLKAAQQPVPDKLVAFGGSTKRKAHSEYGAFYREVDPHVKAKHVKFDDDE